MLKRTLAVLAALLASAAVAAAITVTGTNSANQNSIFKVGFMSYSAKNAITAFATGGQTNAVALVDGINRVTVVATAGDSVKLPAAKAGLIVVVVNADASDAMDVFPQSGEIINALSANTALSVAANKTIFFICAVDGTWNSVLTA